MSKRAYYYDRSFEVSDKNRWVEVYVFGDGDVKIEELHHGVTAAHFQGYIQGVQAAEAKLTGGQKDD